MRLEKRVEHEEHEEHKEYEVRIVDWSAFGVDLSAGLGMIGISLFLRDLRALRGFESGFPS
jgi:hypothetical protein